jgi:putative transposase
LTGLQVNHVIRDRDGMFVPQFDAVLKNASVRVPRATAQAPNQYAFIERWVKSICEECLRHFIVLGQQHFDFLVSSHVDFYNTLRPHQPLNNRPLTGTWCDAHDPLNPDEQVVCRSRLSGLLGHYVRVAA